MDIKGEDYRRFLEAVKKIYENELAEEGIEPKKGKLAYWTEIGENNLSIVSNLNIGTTEVRHFYLRENRLLKKPNSIIEESDKVIIGVLSKIGLSISEELQKKIKHFPPRFREEQEAKFLFKLFINKNVVDSEQNKTLPNLIISPALNELNNDNIVATLENVVLSIVPDREADVVHQENIEDPELQKPINVLTEVDVGKGNLPSNLDAHESHGSPNVEAGVLEEENIKDLELQKPFTTSTELNGDENTPLSNLDPVESATSQNVEVDIIDQEDIKNLKLKRQLIDIIENYFKYLNRGSYGDAFLCWHPEVRAKIYPNGLNQFYESHYFIKSIDLVFQDGLVSFWEDLDDVSFSCNIEKSINGYVSSDVKTICRHSSPNHRGSDNFNTFKKSFERLVSKAEREGFYLANEPIGSFLNFSVFEEIYSLAAFNQDRFKRFLPDLEVVSVRSQVEFQFSKFEEKLMIVAIGNRLYGDISINPENLSNPFKNLK